MCQTIAHEFQDIDLGDKRLNQRAEKILDALAAKPSASINAACDGWNDTYGAYRFFMNENVEADDILAPHRAATHRRIDEQKVVLIAQDTTDLNYSDHPPKDARHLNRENLWGMYDHSHVAFRPDGLCLGVLDVDFFDRSVESLGKTKDRKTLPIEEKESYRWLQGCRLANEVAEAHPDTHVISVSDSEADIYDIFAELFHEDSTADFLIRCKQERCTNEASPEAGKHYKRVREEVAATEVKVIRDVDLPRTPKREGRSARLEIRSKSLVVKPPHQRPGLGEVRCQVVLVEEVGRDEDDPTKVEWLLITTLPVDTVEQTLRVIDYYVGRWPIEPFFRVYKTGCRVEDIQLETTARLKKCLLFYKIIAWRIMYVTHMGREYPNLACDELFLDQEWKPVWKIVTKQPLPEQAPPLSEFLPMLAQLGGYNNRATESPPGPQPIWVGMRRMLDFALAWQAFGPPANGP